MLISLISMGAEGAMISLALSLDYDPTGPNWGDIIDILFKFSEFWKFKILVSD